VPTCPVFEGLVTYVTEFHITWLPHTQNQTYDFNRNGPIHFHPALCISLRVAGMLFVADPTLRILIQGMENQPTTNQLGIQ